LLRCGASRSVDLSDGEADLGAKLAFIGSPFPVIGFGDRAARPRRLGRSCAVPRQAPVRDSVKILSSGDVVACARQETFARTRQF